MDHPSLALEALATAFVEWRATKTCRSSPMPLSLKKDILSLKGHVSPVHIAKVCTLNPSFVRRLFSSHKGGPPSSSFPFLHIPPTGSTATVSSPCSASLVRADGSTLSLSFPSEQLLSLIHAFLCST